MQEKGVRGRPWWCREPPLRGKERPGSERGVCMGCEGAGKATSEEREDPRGWRLGRQGSRTGPGTAGSGGDWEAGRRGAGAERELRGRAPRRPSPASPPPPQAPALPPPPPPTAWSGSRQTLPPRRPSAELTAGASFYWYSSPSLLRCYETRAALIGWLSLLSFFPPLLAPAGAPTKPRHARAVNKPSGLQLMARVTVLQLLP